MRKTATLYFLLLLVLIPRINKVCEGDYLLCQEVNERSLRDRYTSDAPSSLGEEKLETFRMRTAAKVRKDLPSPHSELLLGMTLGIDNLYEVPKFKNRLP